MLFKVILVCRNDIGPIAYDSGSQNMGSDPKVVRGGLTEGFNKAIKFADEINSDAITRQIIKLR